MLMLFNTTRTTSGPPSTGAAIANSLWTEAWPICAADSVQHNAHGPDPQAEARARASNARWGRGAAGVSVAPATARTILATIPYNVFRHLSRARSTDRPTCQMSSPYSRKRAPACARCALCSSRTVHSLTIPRLLPSTVRNASVYRITQAS